MIPKSCMFFAFNWENLVEVRQKQLIFAPKSTVFLDFSVRNKTNRTNVCIFSKVQYHSNKMGYYRFSNSSLSRSYQEMFLKKFDIFFIYSEISLKFFIKNERLVTTTTQSQKLL